MRGTPVEVLRAISPWEMQVMSAAAEGLTYAQIARRHGHTLRSVEKTFERLRKKLRPYGGGSKAGLVHWLDTHHAEWLAGNGIESPDGGLT